MEKKVLIIAIVIVGLADIVGGIFAFNLLRGFIQKPAKVTSVVPNVTDGFVPNSDKSHLTNKSGIIFYDNELFVTVNKGVTNQELNDILLEYDAYISGGFEASGQYWVCFKRARSLEELNNIIDKLVESPKIMKARLVQPAPEIDTCSITNDTLWLNEWNNSDGLNWGIKAIEADKAWDYEEYMSPVNIGVFDDIFQADHEDLLFSSYPLSNPRSLSKKDSSHGTHVAGIIAATHNNKRGIAGVVPSMQRNSKFRLYGVSKDGLKYDDVLKLYSEALRYLIIEKEVKVVNISMAFSLVEFASQWNMEAKNQMNEWADDISILLAEFIDAGYEFVICVAAGNQGDFTNPGSKYRYNSDDAAIFGCVQNDKGNSYGVSGSIGIFARIKNPKVRDRIITVGAIQNNGNGNFSVLDCSQVGDNVDILAPGDNIHSTLIKNGYGIKQGTSMATPHVAGTVAMVFAVNPNLSGEEVRDIVLYSSSTGNYPYSNPHKSGMHRLVNAYLAVDEAIRRIEEYSEPLTEPYQRYTSNPFEYTTWPEPITSPRTTIVYIYPDTETTTVPAYSAVEIKEGARLRTCSHSKNMI